MIPDWQHNCVYLADLLKDRHPSVFSRLQDILRSHGIAVRLLTKVKDFWAKDYCPVQVLPKTLVKFRYEPDYLRHDPDLRTGDEVLESLADLGWCEPSSIVLDGGNVVSSSTKAILTDKIFRENPGWLRPNLQAKLRKLLHVDQVIVIPREPFDPIGHSDSMVRFIDDRAVLVNDYSGVDSAFGERLNQVLCRHGLTVEHLPYYHEKKTVAGIPSAVGNYNNFLRAEKVLVVPAYGTEHDGEAIRKLESVFPGLPIIPLDATDLAREGGVLNCVSVGYGLQPGSCSNN
jgi:agmatine deiminase